MNLLSVVLLLSSVSSMENIVFPVLVLAGVAVLLELYWRGKQQDRDIINDNFYIDTVKIVFADLGGKHGASQSRHIRRALTLEIQSGSEILPVSLLESPVPMSLDEGGRVKLLQTGQDILRRENADVLIWGQIFSADNSYTLSFLKNEEKGSENFARLLCGVEKIHFQGGEMPRSGALAVVTLAMAHAFEVCENDKKRSILGLKHLHDRLEQAMALPKKGKLPGLTDRERLWILAWWSSVTGLQKGEQAMLADASLQWDELLKSWPVGDSSYDSASSRNNQAVVCFFLAQITQEQQWFYRTQDVGQKAQAFFRKTGYPRRWSELEFLVLSVSSAMAIRQKNEGLMQQNMTAFKTLQKSWDYDVHPDFWVRIDVEIDHLQQAFPEKSKVMIPPVQEAEDLPPIV